MCVWNISVSFKFDRFAVYKTNSSKTAFLLRRTFAFHTFHLINLNQSKERKDGQKERMNGKQQQESTNDESQEIITRNMSTDNATLDIERMLSGICFPSGIKWLNSKRHQIGFITKQNNRIHSKQFKNSSVAPTPKRSLQMKQFKCLNIQLHSRNVATGHALYNQMAAES